MTNQCGSVGCFYIVPIFRVIFTVKTSLVLIDLIYEGDRARMAGDQNWEIIFAVL